MKCVHIRYIPVLINFYFSSLAFILNGAFGIPQSQTADIEALLDHELGFIFFKDVFSHACFFDNLPISTKSDNFSEVLTNKKQLARVELPHEFRGNWDLFEKGFSIAQSKLVEEFCSGLPLFNLSLSGFDLVSGERRKRQANWAVRNARESDHWNLPRYEDSTYHGTYHASQASQTQVQGQVYGRGIFSAQAQSQNRGMSQSQIQLAGVGITGQITSSSGSAQSQLSLGHGVGSGQAGVMGNGPSSSQVQINLGQNGEESMASASAISGRRESMQTGSDYSSGGRESFAGVSGSGAGLGHHGIGSGSHGFGSGSTYGSNGNRVGGGAGLTGGNIPHSDSHSRNGQGFVSPGRGDSTQGYHTGFLPPGTHTQHGRGDMTGGQNGLSAFPGRDDEDGRRIRPTQSTDHFDHATGRTNGNGMPRVTSSGMETFIDRGFSTGGGNGNRPVFANTDNYGYGYGPTRGSGVRETVNGNGAAGYNTGSLSGHTYQNGESRNRISGQNEWRQSRTPGAYASSFGVGQSQAQTVYFGNVGNGQYVPVRYDQSSHPGPAAPSTSSGGSDRYQNGFPPGKSPQTTGEFTSGTSTSTSHRENTAVGRNGFGFQSGHPGVNPNVADGHRTNGFRNEYTSTTTLGTPHGHQQSTHFDTSTAVRGDGSKYVPSSIHQPQSELAGSLRPTIQPSTGGSLHYSGSQTPTAVTRLHGPAHSFNELTTSATRTGTEYHSYHRATPQQQHGSTQNGYATVGRNGAYRINGYGQTVPAGHRSQVVTPTTTTITAGREIGQDSTGQNGHFPSYGISQPSPDDPSKRKCTIITFSCTIIIESNGRAKICKPNAVNVNGTPGSSNGSSSSSSSSGSQPAQICCC